MSFQTLEQIATHATVVRVNLLPPEIEAARRSSRLRLALAGGLVVVAGFCGAGFVMTLGHVTDAQSALSAEQGKTAALRAQQKPYAEVPSVLKNVQDAVNAEKTVKGGNIPWYSYIDQISQQSASDITFTSMDLQKTTTAATTTGATAEAANPLVPSGIATVAVVGSAPSQDAVAAWLDAMATIPGVSSPQLQSTSVSTGDASGAGSVTFNASLTLTAAAAGQQ